MPDKSFNIGKKIGLNHKPLVVVEIGINHSGQLKAINIANAAINNGAEIIKHQTHIVDDEYYYKKKSFLKLKENIYQIIKKFFK